jgi:hypothetical protein
MATKQRLVNSKAERDSEAVQDAHKADDAMRQHWNDAVCKEFGVPSHYQSVAVLLIHWAKHLDTQLRCGEEVGASDLPGPHRTTLKLTRLADRQTREHLQTKVWLHDTNCSNGLPKEEARSSATP